MAARPLASTLLLSLCLACSSAPEPEPSEQSAPLQSSEPAPQQRAEAPAAPAAEDKRVAFSVSQADLAAEVLPLFYQQAKILIFWRGESRTVSLSITNPMPWKTALQLVCRFTKTVPRFDGPDRVTLLDESEAARASDSSPSGFDSVPSAETGSRGRRPTPVRRNDPAARRTAQPRLPAYRRSQDRTMDRVRGKAYGRAPQGY